MKRARVAYFYDGMCLEIEIELCQTLSMAGYPLTDLAVAVAIIWLCCAGLDWIGWLMHELAKTDALARSISCVPTMQRKSAISIMARAIR
jgi:hypothetical protein